MPMLVRQAYTSPATGIFAPVFWENTRKEVLFLTVSKEAMEFRDISQHEDVYLMLQLYCPGRQVGLPYRQRMADLPIEEMNLSVRASNALMRANAKSFGRVMDILLIEDGLKKIRNLGVKSEKEIVRSFFTACYYKLNPGEQAVFWQKVIDQAS